MADATRADSVPFDAMKVMLAFQRLKRQTHGAGLCRRGAARHGAGSRPVTSMISRRSGWRAHRNESAPRLPPATSTERHLAPESARHLSGSRRCGWPAYTFPANKKENRGSPALCVSGNFQGKQRVFGAPFWKLASFPESESWSGAKSEAKLRKSARYPGGRRVFSRYWCTTRG